MLVSLGKPATEYAQNCADPQNGQIYPFFALQKRETLIHRRKTAPMLVNLGYTSAEFSAVYKDQQLIERPCFNLPKRETLIHRLKTQPMLANIGHCSAEFSAQGSAEFSAVYKDQ